MRTLSNVWRRTACVLETTVAGKCTVSHHTVLTRLLQEHTFVHRMTQLTIIGLSLKYMRFGYVKYYCAPEPLVADVTNMTFFLVALPALSAEAALSPGFTLACWLPSMMLVLLSRHLGWQLFIISLQVFALMSSFMYTNLQRSRQQFVHRVKSIIAEIHN